MIVVTGASGGIGACLVEDLRADHEVIGTYLTHRPERDLENVTFFQLDVTNPSNIDGFVSTFRDQLEHVTLLNLAGVSLNGMGHKMSEGTWSEVIDTNLKGTFLMSRALLRFMRKEEWGRIINFSSVVAQVGVPGTVAYAASKAGIFGLTRTLAAENATRNITVNALALGYFNVGMIHTIRPDILEQIRDQIPMKRFGDPDVLVRAVRFVMECDYMTGSVIDINGGLR